MKNVIVITSILYIMMQLTKGMKLHTCFVKERITIMDSFKNNVFGQLEHCTDGLDISELVCPGLEI